ncbi:MAG TPA: tRNA (guanosine(37)-N1)-methyltransferase TrmD [Bacteroidales bacterium]|nr:tRNA (guanosine(37)-N1)-methyltransferase TrmD [Bacteroidales bacterium]HPS50693.1 tRNA (guanosine(37)-N1)-methyltransferase TrmD [Bacteroidales bacterium]
MRIDILTLFPEMFEGPFGQSILKRAQVKGEVGINLYNIRNWSTNKHRTVDDYPYGGGAGMVMMVEPVALCIEELKSRTPYDEVIYLSPDGELLNQSLANQLSVKKNLLLLCGHYKGIDERIREHFITREISIGDYVISGGELAAMVVTDAIVRLLPGVLNDETSALSDSYQNNLLSPPVYTRPSDFRGWKVPDVLLSGNEREIKKWQFEKALERTTEKRPHLIDDEDFK